MHNAVFDILILSSYLLLEEIESDLFLHFLDIVEDVILIQVEKASGETLVT
jgi:hypothetical protein